MKPIDNYIAQAEEASRNAYAPYSGYRVGALVKTKSGDTFAGANVENASYGLSLCAERAALAKAANAGHRDIDLVVVFTASSPPAAPCGMCRQCLYEFAKTPEATRVVLVNQAGEQREFSLSDLLPAGFGGKDLP